MIDEMKDLLLDIVTETMSDKIVEYKCRGIQSGFLKINAPYSDSHNGVDANGVSIVTTQPNIFLKLKDLPGEPHTGDDVKVDGIAYRVNEVHFDGIGGALILLHKV